MKYWQERDQRFFKKARKASDAIWLMVSAHASNMSRKPIKKQRRYGSGYSQAALYLVRVDTGNKR